LKTSSLSVLTGLALALLLSAGCGGDKAKEYFEAQEKKEQTKDDSGSASQEPGIDLEELMAPKPKPDDGIPPPKLVDVREIRENYPDGPIRVACSVKYYSDASTVRHGPYTEWYSNGKKFAEGRYADGKKVGEWTYYSFDDGKKAKTGSYKNGLCDGVWTYWRDDGSKQREERYASGDRDGRWVLWHKNGQKAVEENYVHGKLDGKRITWDKDGKKTSEVVYRNGVVVERVAVNKG
jgi:antitoxin component YwqK of YwqJK toxin-antitoxin module